MKQGYHSNATTNIHLRSEINKSTKSNSELSVQYSVSGKTIANIFVYGENNTIIRYI